MRAALIPNIDSRRAIRVRMQAAAMRLRLPFRSRVWRGPSGAWQGAGAGSSIDFQDHRAYLPGDDPRHIDWQAYARSGQYTMKLYREEVSPAVDLVLDVSASMFVTPEKANRVLELFYFSLESARQSGAALQCYVLRGAESAHWPVEAALGDGDWTGLRYQKMQFALPWRQGSLRALISDLLFPGAPDPLLTMLGTARGSGVIFAPFAVQESAPDWEGNIEFIDCESELRRVQQVNPALLERYQAAYRRHFALWTEASQRRRVVLARVGEEPDFLAAMRRDALARGAVEMCA
ncbi:MAG TPA: DUF58 domain-containing protein [Chthoniobacterales bacterium]